MASYNRMVMESRTNQHDAGVDYLSPSVEHVRKQHVEARRMVEFGHYLHKWPGVVTCCLLLRVAALLAGRPYQRAVGVVVFALPPRETNKRYGGFVWELARLWISDEMPRNSESWFIARAVRYVQKTYPEVDFLVSYADPSHGHRGTIYKASNWLADGRTDQERKSPRCDYVAAGKRYSRRSHVPVGVLPTRVPRVSKYRFVYPLKRADRRKLAA